MTDQFIGYANDFDHRAFVAEAKRMRLRACVAVDRFGEVGTIHELPAPVAGPDEILVRIRYVA